MTATKARAVSSILVALLGPNLSASAARADGAADAVRQVGQPASRAQAVSRASQLGTSASIRQTSKPLARREAPATARRRARRRRAGTWSGQQFQSSQ